MVNRRLHTGLTFYLEKRNADPGVQHLDGSVHLTFDMQFRVCFFPTSGNAVLLQSKIIELSLDSQKRRSSIEMLLERMGEELDQKTEAIVLSHDQSSLILQQLMPEPVLGSDFEKILENFINVLASLRYFSGAH